MLAAAGLTREQIVADLIATVGRVEITDPGNLGADHGPAEPVTAAADADDYARAWHHSLERAGWWLP